MPLSARFISSPLVTSRNACGAGGRNLSARWGDDTSTLFFVLGLPLDKHSHSLPISLPPHPHKHYTDEMSGPEDDAPKAPAAAAEGAEGTTTKAAEGGEGGEAAAAEQAPSNGAGGAHKEDETDLPVASTKREEGSPEEGEEGKNKRSKDKERRRRSRSPRGSSRGRKEKRKSRSRSNSPRGDRRKRSRERERGSGSRRSRRSASASRSPSPSSSRRARRRERVNNWDKPPEAVPGLVTGLPALGGLTGLGGMSLGGLGGVGGTAGGGGQFLDPPMLDPSVMMGTSVLGPGGVVRGAIGTLTAPTAPPNQQELFNGVLVPTMMLRQAKRLYVGNVPMGCDQFVLMQLFNQAMVAAGKGSASAPPIVGVQVNEAKPFAFLETRTPEDAANVLLFDGITIGANQLKVRRPKDFKPLPGIIDPPTGTSLIPGHLPTSVENTENKIYLGSIPTHFNDLQVRELVSAFGELKAFNLVKDPAMGTSKGFCFFEYLDHSLTDQVCSELNGFELGDRKLICQRANPSPASAAATAALGGVAGLHPYAALLTGQAGGGSGGGGAVQPPLGPPTKVLKLSNMVVEEELKDDSEYEEIVMDIKEECGKYGNVVSLKVPRPTYKEDGSVDVSPPGVGEVFVEFEEEAGAMKAGNALRNRQFSGRTVVCGFVKEEEYAAGNY